MIESPDRLTNLAAAVADGRPTDWDSAESSASDETERALIARLRAIEAIGRLGSLHSLTSTAGLVEPPPFHEPQTAAHVASLRTWGPLRLLERIARGRFGDVYRAWDPRLDRPVALKLLRRRDDDGTDESLIVEEGRLMARVRHPNVVTIFGAERIDGRTGLWMEFIDGRTLEAELAERGPLTSDEVSRVGVELCRALAAVHDAGLVHRDVKAQNVLRESGGRIVLGDFGTGRELDEDADRSSGIAGTPAYLAPEIFRAAPATPQSDLYSLGVLLFHLATGQYPVQGRSLREIRDAHAFGRRRSIRTLCANLPEALLETIERALDAEPSRRFESARAMEAALSAAVTPVADRSRGSSDTPRLRAGRVTSAMIGALVLSAGIGVVVWRDRLNSVVERRDTETHPVAAERGDPLARSVVRAPSGDAEQATQDTRAVSKPSLTFNAGDWVVVANVDNQTGEPLLDGVVEAAVKRELEFSDYIRVAQRGRVEDTLRALGRPLDTRLDRPLAQEISLRDGGVRAYIAGGIAKAGGTYEIALDVVNPASQTTIATLTDRAPRQADILAALRRQTLRLRETLGEPPASVDRSRQVFQQMPLPKLKALKLYAESLEVDQRPGTPRDHNEAIRQMMREAIREDPTFARLYLRLSEANIGEGGRAEEILPNSERAFQLAATATPQERYRIIAGYYHQRANRNNTPGHAETRKIHRCSPRQSPRMKRCSALQPDDDGVMVLLRNCYRVLGRERDTAWMNLRLADARPRNVGVNLDVAKQLAREGNFDGARRYAARAASALSPAGSGALSGGQRVGAAFRRVPLVAAGRSARNAKSPRPNCRDLSSPARGGPRSAPPCYLAALRRDRPAAAGRTHDRRRPRRSPRHRSELVARCG